MAVVGDDAVKARNNNVLGWFMSRDRIEDTTYKCINVGPWVLTRLRHVILS